MMSAAEKRARRRARGACDWCSAPRLPGRSRCAKHASGDLAQRQAKIEVLRNAANIIATNPGQLFCSPQTLARFEAATAALARELRARADRLERGLPS